MSGVSLQSIGPNRRAVAITREIEQAVQEFFPANQMRFPAQMIIATGKKPHERIS
jgi:hypothetical protein